MTQTNKRGQSRRGTRAPSTTTPAGASRTALVAVITSAIAQRSLTPITRRIALKLA